ncbi:MAG: flagellar motor switch protein FliN [Phycisphaerales bacterium JB039]
MTDESTTDPQRDPTEHAAAGGDVPAPEAGESAASEAERALRAAQDAIRGLEAQSAAGAGQGAKARPGAAPRPVEMPSFSGADGAEAAGRGLDLLSDVNLNVRIELGRTRMLVEDVLRLGEGAVVELDKLAGDPVDVYVNGRPVARGEVLVLNDNFCIRISEILDEARERVEQEAAG